MGVLRRGVVLGARPRGLGVWVRPVGCVPGPGVHVLTSDRIAGSPDDDDYGEGCFYPPDVAF